MIYMYLPVCVCVCIVILSCGRSRISRSLVLSSPRMSTLSSLTVQATVPHQCTLTQIYLTDLIICYSAGSFYTWPVVQSARGQAFAPPPFM